MLPIAQKEVHLLTVCEVFALCVGRPVAVQYAPHALNPATQQSGIRHSHAPDKTNVSSTPQHAPVQAELGRQCMDYRRDHTSQSDSDTRLVNNRQLRRLEYQYLLPTPPIAPNYQIHPLIQVRYFILRPVLSFPGIPRDWHASLAHLKQGSWSINSARGFVHWSTPVVVVVI